MKKLLAAVAVVGAVVLAGCGGGQHAAVRKLHAAPSSCPGGYVTQYGCSAHSPTFGLPPLGVRAVAPSSTPSIAMADSVTVSALPHGLSAYAGYVNGNFENFTSIAAAFPGVAHVPVTVQAFPVYPSTAKMACLDIESGDAAPSAAGPWTRGEIGLGVKPCLYANLSTMPAVRASLNAAGLSRSSYLLWVADWTGHSGVIPGFDATQWLNHGPNGENYDQNSVTRAFLDLTPAPKPVPDIGGRQHYERYDNARRTFHNASGKIIAKAIERNTVRTWDQARCENPVRRPVCKSSRYHLSLLRGRLLAIHASGKRWTYGTPTSIGKRNQEIWHRLNSRKPIKSWSAGL